MDNKQFDCITRAFGATSSRRSAAKTLGAGSLAALVGRFAVEEDAEAKKKPSKLARKKVKAKCKSQISQCTAVFREACADVQDPGACEQRFARCCDLAGACNAGAMAECILTNLI